MSSKEIETQSFASPLLRFAKNRTIPLALFGGLIFCSVFAWRYSNIESHFYQVRDDGVITMSHAKNLVDYGFIGVNPSGDRVEGYSAPVQFFIFAVAYALSEVSYDVYANAQTVIATFLLGALFILFFRSNSVYAIALTTLSALLLSYHTSFLEWHGSGMENPITHVLFLSTVLILFTFAKTGNITYSLAPVVFLATISRLDSVYHIAPLLGIFSVFWLLSFKNLRGFFFSFTVFGFWLGYHLWRYMYFGDILPNTAYAQNIRVGDQLVHLINLDKRMLGFSERIFSHHGGYLLIVASPFLYFVHRERSVLLLFLLIASFVLTSYLNPFFFGIPRLDPVRTTTHLAVFTALSISAIIYYLENKRHLIGVGFVLLLSCIFALKLNIVKPYSFCCRVQFPDSYRKEFSKLAERESLPRPTVSNPDLGVMSWHKQFNIVDLTWLGTPIMAKFKYRLPLPLIIAEYIFTFAAPDLIQSHGVWSCRYDDIIFSDPRFDAKYHPIHTRISNWTKEHCKSNPKSQSGIWIRRDILQSSESPERKLIDALATELSTERLRRELKICQSNPGSNCVYVSRTAYRFLPEFRDRGDIDKLKEIFFGSRTKDYDLYLIQGYRDGQAHVGAVEFIAGLVSDSIVGTSEFGQAVIRSTWDVYLQGNRLVYTKYPCSLGDIENRFFLHLIPVDGDTLPEHRRQYGFDKLSFGFKGHGVDADGRCIATRKLPAYDISQITTGQYSRMGRIWEGNFHFVE